ncbi:hypothetical protein HAV_00188 [Candidatus Hepatincola sp. Av]
MRIGSKGGASTKTGLGFEGIADVKTFLQSQPSYKVNDKNHVYYQGKLVAKLFKQRAFYKFLDSLNINWQDCISKKILPDNSIYVIEPNTIYIVECKFQQVKGTVDEKLQTCHFKKQQYKKLLSQSNINIEYVYLLNNWFLQNKYKDVLHYIQEVGCYYYFNTIPLEKIGLPYN